jgi:hypothetical protein
MKKRISKKSPTKLNTKEYIFLGTLFLSVLFVVSTGLIFRDLMINVVKDTTFHKSESLVIEGKGQQIFPHTESVYELKASPDQANTDVVMVRLDFENATVVDFKPEQKFLVIGVCENGKAFYENKICVDLGNTAGIISENEKLGEIKLRFGSQNSFSVLTAEGNGFFNGNELSLNENTAMNFESDSFLPMTGEETSSTFDLTNYPLFLGITAFIILASAGGVVYLVFRKDSKDTKEKVARVVTVVGVVVLLGGVFYVSNIIVNRNTAPEESSALSIGPEKIANTKEMACPELIKEEFKWYNKWFVYDPLFYCANHWDKFASLPNVAIDKRFFEIFREVKCYECISCQKDIAGSVKSCAKPTSTATVIIGKSEVGSKEKPDINEATTCVEDGDYYYYETGIKCCSGDENYEWDFSIQRNVCGTSSSPEKENTIEGKTQVDKSPNLLENCTEIKNNGWLGGTGSYCSTSPEGWLIQCNGNGTVPSSGSGKECEEGCQREPAGKADYCKEDAPTSSPNTSIINNSSSGISDSTSTTSQNTQSTTTTSGAVACGKMGCATDSDCAGYVDNVQEGSATCDEAASHNPSDQQCVKICKNGYAKNDPCTCSTTTPDTVICGAMDSNSDKILNFIDMHDFLKVYNKTCSNNPVSTWSCGGQDVNADKTINNVDHHAFLANYYTKVADCTGMPGSTQ